MDAKKRLAAFKVEGSPGAGSSAARPAARPKGQPAKPKRGQVRDNDGDYEPLRNMRPIPPMPFSKTPEPLPPAESPETVSGSDSDPDGEVVDLEYIHSHRPAVKVVRKFMQIQAQAVSAAEEDDFL
jgi:hypothetical protein